MIFIFYILYICFETLGTPYWDKQVLKVLYDSSLILEYVLKVSFSKYEVIFQNLCVIMP